MYQSFNIAVNQFRCRLHYNNWGQASTHIIVVSGGFSLVVFDWIFLNGKYKTGVCSQIFSLFKRNFLLLKLRMKYIKKDK